MKITAYNLIENLTIINVNNVVNQMLFVESNSIYLLIRILKQVILYLS